MEKGNPHALLGGMQIGTATVESSMEIPQKIKNPSASQPSNPTSGDMSEETQNTNLKHIFKGYMFRVYCSYFLRKHPVSSNTLLYFCRKHDPTKV